MKAKASDIEDEFLLEVKRIRPKILQDFCRLYFYTYVRPDRELVEAHLRKPRIMPGMQAVTKRLNCSESKALDILKTIDVTRRFFSPPQLQNSQEELNQTSPSIRQNAWAQFKTEVKEREKAEAEKAKSTECVYVPERARLSAELPPEWNSKFACYICGQQTSIDKFVVIDDHFLCPKHASLFRIRYHDLVGRLEPYRIVYDIIEYTQDKSGSKKKRIADVDAKLNDLKNLLKLWLL